MRGTVQIHSLLQRSSYLEAPCPRQVLCPCSSRLLCQSVVSSAYVSDLLGRTICFAFTALILIACPLEAQRPGATIGFAGGATSSNLADSGGSARWGGTTGVFYTHMYRSRLPVLTLEVNWTQKGWRDDAQFGDSRITYIEMPLTFGLVYPVARGTGIRGYGGIEAGFRIKCETQFEGGCDTRDDPGTIVSVPIGLVVGRMSLSGVFTAVEIRYSFTLGTVTIPVTRDPLHRTWYFRLIIGKHMGY